MAVTEVLLKLGEVLQPLATTTAERRKEILESARLVRLPTGNPLFQEGDRDTDTVFLVRGSIDTYSGGYRLKRIDAGTPTAAWPLPDDQPRKVTAKATTDVGLLLIPRSLIAPLFDYDDDVGLEVKDLDEDSDTGDWMTMLLRSPLYSRLPVSNIQRIMAMMESMAVEPDEVIVRQGDAGDYYYFLNRGRARVLRQTRDGEAPVLLAEIKEGVSFGEEALVAGLPRNATVIMTTEGRVMRLSKEHFDLLILEPTLQRIEWPAAAEKVDQGAIWIDVRFPDEFERNGISSALNIPLGMLRMRMPKLNRNSHYIAYCDTGQRSAAGAFLLAGAGFDVYVLNGGIEPHEAKLHEFNATASPIPTADSKADDLDDGEVSDDTQPIDMNIMARYLRNTIDALEQEKASSENRADDLLAQLNTTREALETERQRVQELVSELQTMRQTLSEFQRRSHAALERERRTYEKELAETVENLEHSLLEKDMQLEAERDKSQAEIERLRRLLAAVPARAADEI